MTDIKTAEHLKIREPEEREIGPGVYEHYREGLNEEGE
jgi:hypothetical protein